MNSAGRVEPIVWQVLGGTGLCVGELAGVDVFGTRDGVRAITDTLSKSFGTKSSLSNLTDSCLDKITEECPNGLSALLRSSLLNRLTALESSWIACNSCTLELELLLPVLSAISFGRFPASVSVVVSRLTNCNFFCNSYLSWLTQEEFCYPGFRIEFSSPLD